MYVTGESPLGHELPYEVAHRDCESRRPARVGLDLCARKGDPGMAAAAQIWVICCR